MEWGVKNECPGQPDKAVQRSEMQGAKKAKEERRRKKNKQMGSMLGSGLIYFILNLVLFFPSRSLLEGL